MEEYLSKMDAMDTAEDNIEQKKTELKLLEKKIKKVMKMWEKQKMSLLPASLHLNQKRSEKCC
jgi:flagellar motility protein MotE (MotC chaperone)